MAGDAPAARKCAGKDCDNDASQLQCPNCQKLGRESYFCSQDCFKRNWVHSKTRAGARPALLTRRAGGAQKVAQVAK
jgi:methionyl aminopeptidase